MESEKAAGSKITERRFGCLQVIGLMLIAALITAGVAFFIFKTYLFPSAFKPVTLNSSEEKVLAIKLDNFDSIKKGGASLPKDAPAKPSQSDRSEPNGPITPEPYSEEGTKRVVGFTERELNSLIAKNTDLATKLAIDLSDDLVSAKLLLPVDEDFPLFGGKILRLKSGVVFSYTNGKPVVILKGITIMGVPLPNAWMGGIKNIDLVDKFGTNEGFWKTFSDGVEKIKVEDGLLKIKFRE